MRFEETILTERLPLVGGRGIQRFPDLKPGRAGSPQFPSGIAGTMVAWYDPSDAANVTMSGGKVSSLTDKSGTGNTATATNPVLLGVPPSMRRPMLAFVSDRYFDAAVSMSDVTSSGFIVAMVADLVGYRCLLGQTGGSGGIAFRINQTTGKVNMDKSETATIGTNDAFPVSAGTPFVAGYLLGSSSVTIYNNLSSETDAHAQSLTAGRTLRFGRNGNVFGGNEDFMVGWVGEIIMYSDTLSSGDAAKVIGYLMSKWGIA